MAMDINSLIAMNNQVSSGTKPSSKTAGGFRSGRLPAGNKNPGGFSAPWEDPVHQARMRSLARMDPRISFVNAYGERESGWQYQHPPLLRITDYDRILDMVQTANDLQRVKVTAPPGTYERSAQQAEQLANPVREHRKTVREVLTGRR